MHCACLSKDLSCRPSIGHARRVHLVVAHCFEDLSWINDYKYTSVYIYQKCNATHASASQRKHTYDNGSLFAVIPDYVGREAHAYLNFIVRNFAHIRKDDMYAFVQGHAPKEIQFSPLNVSNVSETLRHLSNNTGFAQLSGVFTRLRNPPSNANIIDRFVPAPQVLTLRGQFIVSGWRIRSVRMDVWRRYVQYEKDHPTPLAYKRNCGADCFFELMWGSIFGCVATKRCLPWDFPWGRHTYTSGILECYDSW